MHDLGDIRASVKTYVEALTGSSKDAEIRVGQLDERLQLAKCSIKPEHYLPPGGKTEGRFVVGIRCNGDMRWSIFVPVTLVNFGTVVVTNRPLLRGETINKDNVDMLRKPLNELTGGYILSLDKVLGKVVKYPLGSGSVLNTGNLNAAISVRRGDKVNILAKNSQINVKMAGVALMDGAEGQRIRVKNLLSNRIVEGTITYDGNVRVGL